MGEDEGRQARRWGSNVRRIARAHYDALEAHHSVAAIVRAFLRVPPGTARPALVRALEERHGGARP